MVNHTFTQLLLQSKPYPLFHMNKGKGMTLMGYKVFIFKLLSRLPQVPCTHDSLVCIMGSHLLCLSFMVVVVGLYEPCLSFNDLSENKMDRPSSHLHCSMGLDCDVAKLIHCILFGELFASICEFRV